MVSCLLNAATAKSIEKINKLGNFTLLQHFVHNSVEQHRQAIVITLLIQQYIESDFNPKARSTAGALGIAQILPHHLKDILHLNALPDSISLDLGTYAQVEYFNRLWEKNINRLKRVGFDIGVEPRLHHLLNIYLIQYIGGETHFGSDESYKKILRGERHSEPKKRSKHHQPYAVNLYVTKILGVFDVLSTEKNKMPDNAPKRITTIAERKISNIEKIIKGLGYDVEDLRITMEEKI